MKTRPLLIITTFNKLDMTKKCLEQDLPCEVLVIDDCSTDGTQEYLSERQIECHCKTERKGLTDSWNWAYRYFKVAKEYTHLIISNNDVLYPKGSIEGLLSDYPLTVPMTTHQGAGYAAKGQSVDYHLDLGDLDPGWARNAHRIQNSTTRGFIYASSWTGFCMCFARTIHSYERSDGNLVDPSLINVGNDDYLAKTLRARLALGSFVFHYKGHSFNKQIGNRDDLRKTY